MYYRARWYDANLGRFISEDPIGFAGGDINLFGYVWNNPQGWTDPSGLRGDGGWGEETADWLDENIEYARDYYKYGQESDWWNNGNVNTIADVARGTSDLLRVGSGTGDAIYGDDNGWGRAANIAMDISRGAAIFGMFAAPGARLANTPTACSLNNKLVRFTGREYPYRSKTFRVSPLGNRTNPPHPI